MNRKHIATKVAIALSAVFGLPVLAQSIDTEPETKKNSAFEVILVTAQKRVQNVKEVPISISSVNQEKLLEANISDSEELSTYISNFSVSQSGQGFNVIMRGLGSGPNQGFEQTVGTFVDGIYRGRGHLMRSAFLDLERVEVLRGPQSALFGKNTTAGALNLTNAKPTEDLQGYVNLNYDFDFETTTVETAVSNSLSDNVQGRIALKYVDEGGYIENTLSGNDEVAHETLLGRLTLAWQPTDKVDVLLSAQHDQDDFIGYSVGQTFVEPAIAASGAPILSLIGDYVIDDKVSKADPALGEEQKGSFDASHVTLNIEYDMEDTVLTSTTGYQSYELIQSNDGDQSALALIYRPLGNEKYVQLSQEFRLTSAFDSAFNYIAGVYYQTSDLDYLEDFTVYAFNSTGNRDFRVDSDTAAIFAQFDYDFSENWQATLGLRYSKEDKDGYRKLISVDAATGTPIVDMPLVTAPAIANSYPDGLPGAIFSSVVLGGQNIFDHEISAQRTENNFTPALNIRYKMEDAMLYASVSAGAKAGGFDSRANNPTDFEFEDEEVVSTEVGTKLTLDDGSADINIAIFNMVFENLQTSIYDGSTGFFVENAGEATSRGLELDGRWAFANNWIASGSLGLLDFKWDEFKGAKCFQSVTKTPDNIEEGGESCDYTGKTNAFAPKVSGSVNIEYYTELSDSIELKASIDLIHKSDFYTNPDLNPWTEQQAYTKVNARIALLDIEGSWQVALLGKNLTDEITLNYSTDMPLVGAGFYNVMADPGRSVSLQFSYNFE
jgi:outer membrane receptor protein involved in Fe transport